MTKGSRLWSNVGLMTRVSGVTHVSWCDTCLVTWVSWLTWRYQLEYSSSGRTKRCSIIIMVADVGCWYTNKTTKYDSEVSSAWSSLRIILNIQPGSLLAHFSPMSIYTLKIGWYFQSFCFFYTMWRAIK